MKKRAHYYTYISLMLGVMLTASAFVSAEDTEVYLGASNTPSAVRPNLTFIIDTSGSMDTDVTSTTTNGTYNPATTYTGSCNASRTYWSSNGTPPSCSTDQYFNNSANKCNASSTALSSGGSGLYVGKLAYYRPRSRGGNRWESLSTSSHSDAVECEADWGNHGETGASNPYPADASNGGPWRANTSNAISWNSIGGTYTLYNANYLNWRASAVTTVTKSRLQIVKEVFSTLMDSISNVNVAVIRYDDKSQELNKGGYFVMPMQQLTDANRASYKTAVNNFNASGYTPLAETMFESYLYYRGDNVKFGNSTTPGTNVAGVLLPGNTGKYKSPIEYQCQKNFTILLTDGDPTYDTDADAAIKALPGFSTVTGSSTCNGNCLDELTQYMNSQDCSSSLNDKQNVITYTIGFTLDLPLLRDAATKGGGKYYTADDTAGLTDAFTSILTEILAINTTFIAPAVSVNAFNRFTHRDELYYALFRPSARPKWDGNVKRFKLAGNPAAIVDKDNVAAIDPATGFFKKSATSFWTSGADAPDGDEVKKGGAASKLVLPRNIYTFTGSVANNELLTAAGNKLHEDNAAVTAAMLGNGSMSATDRTELLQWARGVDLLDENGDASTSDIRRHMGDPLHSKPLLVTYGGTDASPDMTLYIGTNEGYLQAINTTTGSELFSFIPQELLPNIQLRFDDAATTPHPYGLDGPLTHWFNDINSNGLLYNTSNVLDAGESVYLYQGMRRGGKNYYALDVTNRTAPKLKWVIKGGEGDFSELSQTWSAATKAKIKLNGADKDVLIFGGGYDTAQDNNTTAQNDTTGRAIYIVDANTGAKLWQAGPAGTANGSGGNPNLLLSGMTNSIPADVTVIDTNGDGYTDRMYAADMRGQLWRFDIKKSNTGATDLATGGIIAKLGDATAAGNRRFYYAPDVSMSKDRTQLNIAIGSGYRAHPLNTTIRDAFFVIADKNIYSPAVDNSGNPVYTAITMSDLYDTTSNIIGQGTQIEISAAKIALSGKKGWYIWMSEPGGSFIGEKVLAKSFTFSDILVFTTYTPIAANTGACSPSQGRAITYIVNIKDGSPVYDFNQSGGTVLTHEDRRMTLVRGGIPPEPSLLFHENGPVLLIGTEKTPDLPLLLTPRKTHWKTK